MTFLDGLGPRVVRRCQPRLAIAAAGAGCALAILGILVIGTDSALTADSSGVAERLPGAVLSAIAVAAGFLVLARIADGPLATAGAVASALGVPPLVLFITLDRDHFPPFSVDAVLIVSAAAWLVSWAFGPGRGRAFYLGAGLIALWMSVLQVVEGAFDADVLFPPLFFGATTQEFEAVGEPISPPGDPFGTDDPVVTDDPFGTDDPFDVGGSPEPILPGDIDVGGNDVANPNTIGALSLGFGAAYLAGSRALDRRGRVGAATPMLVAAIPALAVAVLALAEEFEQSGTGLLLAAIGLALAANGATTGRRLTTWLGGGAIALGVGLVTSEPVDDATVGGTVLILTGLGLVVLAELAGRALGEPPETEPVPSAFGRQPSADLPPSTDIDEVPPPEA